MAETIVDRPRAAGLTAVGVVLRLIGVIALVLFFSGCVRVLSRTAATELGEREPLYVVFQGFHTGVALDTAILGGERRTWMPNGMRYVEIGFGERRYYMNSSPGPLSALRAVALRNAGVLHVAGFNDLPERYFSGADVLELKVRPTALWSIIEFIDRSFNRGPSGAFERLADGIYGESAFYAAVPRFSALYNCNDWALELLESAGCETQNVGISTQGSTKRALQRLPGCG